MHFKMPPALPEAEKEPENLFAERDTMEKTAPYTDFIDFSKKRGSAALHEYDKMCDEIRASLQPGEYV